ncbi:MAG: Hsp20/alpha crystallin family protein [Planctomycetota bacterium]|nr:Hsp20/alpha crystallin family protein [Planctomycetota bacterium]
MFKLSNRPEKFRRASDSLVTSIEDEMSRIMDEFFQEGGRPRTMFAPQMDIRETKDEVEVKVDLPGMKKEDVEILVEDSVLTIRGEKKEEKKEGGEDEKYHLIERYRGSFERSVRLSHLVDSSKVKANFTDGTLCITMPKVEEAKPRKIEIS